MKTKQIQRKRGRQKAHYEASDGSRIVGLARRPSDGRWRIIDTGFTFTEPDEHKAITRFYELTNKNLDLEKISYEGSPVDELLKGFSLHYGSVLGGLSAEQRMWKWIGRQIIDKPRWCASMSGVEELGYLKKIQAPEKVPTVAEIALVWNNHFTKTDKRKVLSAWEDFTETMCIKAVDDITAETVVEYQDDVHFRTVNPRGGEPGPISGKQQQHIFTSIRRILRFAKGRAMGIESISKALECLSILKPNESTVTRNPKPISVEHWNMIYKSAEGDDLAMILLGLNAAMYLREIIRLRWDDIRPDGTIVTHRQKKGQIIRVCVLWPETLKALQGVKRLGDYIFNNYARQPLGISGAQLRFNNLAEAAKCPEVTGSMLRDGAFTAAVEANVSEQLTRILVPDTVGGCKIAFMDQVENVGHDSNSVPDSLPKIRAGSTICGLRITYRSCKTAVSLDYSEKCWTSGLISLRCWVF